MSNVKVKKARSEYTRIFVVKESYTGTKKLSDIFSDMLYSAYCKPESEIKGKNSLQGRDINRNGYPSAQSVRNVCGGNVC